jgi:hypothetical protein
MSLRRNKGGFIETQLLIYAGIALGVVLLLGYVYHLGSSNMAAKYEAKLADERSERAKEILRYQLELNESEQQREIDAATAAQKLKDNDDSWKGKVKGYVPYDPKRNCPVTTGWVQYHDERAAGLPYGAGPPVGTANTPAGVDETKALETVGDNYSLYFACKERVRQLINKYEAVEKLVNKATTSPK